MGNRWNSKIRKETILYDGTPTDFTIIENFSILDLDEEYISHHSGLHPRQFNFVRSCQVQEAAVNAIVFIIASSFDEIYRVFMSFAEAENNLFTTNMTLWGSHLGYQVKRVSFESIDNDIEDDPLGQAEADDKDVEGGGGKPSITDTTVESMVEATVESTEESTAESIITNPSRDGCMTRSQHEKKKKVTKNKACTTYPWHELRVSLVNMSFM